MDDRDHFYDIFLIYHPIDIELTRRVAAQLDALGSHCGFLEQPLGKKAADIEQLKAGILRSYTVGMVLSADSAVSQLCNELIQYAVSNGKRLVTLILDEDIEVEVHPAIADNPFVFFRESDELVERIEELRGYLQVERPLQLHTELLVAADEWQRHGRAPELLLPADRLEEARQWLAERGTRLPKPSPLQVEYIHSGRRQGAKSWRILSSNLKLGIAGIIAVLLVLALLRIALANRAAAESAARETQQAQKQLALIAAESTAASDSAIATIDMIAATSVRLAEAMRETVQAEAMAATQAAKSTQAAQALAERRAAAARATQAFALAREAQAGRLVAAGVEALAAGDHELALALAWEAKEALEDAGPAYQLLRQAAAEHPILTSDSDLQAALPGTRISPSGGSLLLAEESGISLYSLSRQEIIARMEASQSSQAGDYFATYGNGSAAIYAIDTGEQLRSWELDGGDARALYLSAHGQMLVLALDSDELWLLHDDAPQRLDAGGLVQPANLAFAPSGETFVSLHQERAVLWDTETGTALGAYPLGGAGATLEAAFSATGETLFFFLRLDDGLASLTAVTLADNSVRRHTFVDVQFGQFSDDGAYLALVLADGDIQIIETASGETVYRLGAGLHSARKLRYLAEAGLLIAADRRDLTIWDVSTGELEWRFRHPRTVTDFSVSQDGQRILTLDAGNRHRLWRVESPAELLARIETMYSPRALTCPEREQYQLLPLCE